MEEPRAAQPDTNERDHAMSQLGLSGETCHLLALFPLLYAAWADHDPAPTILETLQERAAAHGLDDGDAGKVLSDWIEENHRSSFWRHGLFLVGHFLGHETLSEEGSLSALCLRLHECIRAEFGDACRPLPSLEVLLSECVEALGVEDDEAYSVVRSAVLKQALDKETRRRQPIQWSWVNRIAMLLSLCLAAALYIQHFGLTRWFPDSYLGFATSWPGLQGGVLLFGIVPLVPFLFAGVLLGLRSPGRAVLESLLSSLFPLLLFWATWLVLLLAVPQQDQVWWRLGMNAALTLAAIGLMSLCARIGVGLASLNKASAAASL